MQGCTRRQGRRIPNCFLGDLVKPLTGNGRHSSDHGREDLPEKSRAIELLRYDWWSGRRGLGLLRGGSRETEARSFRRGEPEVDYQGAELHVNSGQGGHDYAFSRC